MSMAWRPTRRSANSSEASWSIWTRHFCRRMAPISQESQGHQWDAKTAGGQTIPCLPSHSPVLGQVPPTWFGYWPGSTTTVVTEGGEVVAGSWGRIQFPGGERNVATGQGSDALWSWLATGFSHRQFLVLHLGAVLSHCTVEGEEWSIACASRSLSTPKKKYWQIEKEVLSLAWGVKKFQTSWGGHHFTMDHQPLECIMDLWKAVPVTAAARIKHWCLFIGTLLTRLSSKDTNQHANNCDGLSILS